MIKEDNDGFINFPTNREIKVSDGGTMVYLIAFSVDKNEISNVKLNRPGILISDDVLNRQGARDYRNMDISGMIEQQKEQDSYDIIYFPNTNSDIEKERNTSIDIVTAICIGWSEYKYEIYDRMWHAGFNNLTHEGKNLYYSIKKLHNNKEVRLLTFNIENV